MPRSSICSGERWPMPAGSRPASARSGGPAAQPRRTAMMSRTLPKRPARVGPAAPPETLPARIFLLAYDPAKGRLANRSTLGKTLRAAALIDLQLRGNLADDNGRAHLTKAAPPRDEVLAGLLTEIRTSNPRKWRTWIDRRQSAIVRDTRAELERAQLIKVESHRFLGLIPTQRITLRQPLVRRQLLQRTTDVLRPARLVTRIDLRDAALAVLASTSDLRTVIPKELRNRHKDRLAQLAIRIGPVAPALKKSIQASHAAASGGG
ncbi:GPP34 family phosphoprotein [Kribbella albertanoniae]|uniref:GPP34 family phosphoprotein n=2 Tax=Kribbella albertanoniae TaxID=1266829 RepID=A0A4R4NXR6_9ACTN|nr:GPP34 family phosphoprotein [Kribbella albertanoniae]